MALLRWAGSKTRLLGELEKRLPSDYSSRVHVEPFAGSAALFFHLRPAQAALYDICAPLMNFYRTLEVNPSRLWGKCFAASERFTASPREAYLESRARLDVLGLEGATAFWLVNQTCFNGLWRENAKGEMNVPIGSKTKLAAPEMSEFLSASTALRRADLFLRTWKAEEDFVYADPPYDEGFTQYNARGWKRSNLVLLRWLLKEFGGPWMLSNADTPFVREMFDGFRIEKVTVHRSMRPNGKRTADELIIRNY